MFLRASVAWCRTVRGPVTMAKVLLRRLVSMLRGRRMYAMGNALALAVMSKEELAELDAEFRVATPEERQGAGEPRRIDGGGIRVRPFDGVHGDGALTSRGPIRARCAGTLEPHRQHAPQAICY